MALALLGAGGSPSFAGTARPGPAHLVRVPERVTAARLPLWASGTNFRWIQRVLWEPQYGGHVFAMTSGYRVVKGRFEVWTPNVAPGWYRLVIENRYGMSNRPWIRVYPSSRFRAPWGCPVTWNGYSIQGHGGTWILCKRSGSAGAHWSVAPIKKST